jgi:Domain of unknown function (DUF4397)
MLRLLRALPLALALAALSLFVSSCGSSNSSQIRFVHAIRDAGPLDIEVNSSKIFTDVAFFGYQPSSGYTKVSSGSVTVAGLATGTTTQVFSSTASLGSGDYTLIATGSENSGTNGSGINLLSIPDTNTAPATGNVEFRVINASQTGGTVDVYILANPVNGGIQPPATISGLAYTQASGYITRPFNSKKSGYTMYVTSSGTTNPIFSQNLSSPTSSIRTLVLTDVANSSGLNTTAIELRDLN